MWQQSRRNQSKICFSFGSQDEVQLTLEVQAPENRLLVTSNTSNKVEC
ncbi:hypothetical protein NIES2104_30400 [Leptolyngbya sp. NIES-2104]|nr:hypothetical protein NIES2104_30400 [Leptolyngbya sp. NIES-2104]